MRYRIWSFEHTAFWRADWQGYTVNVRESGKYEEAEAREIVKGARGDEVALLADYNKPNEPPSPDVIVYDPSSTISLNTEN